MTDERLAEIRAHIEAPCREIWLSQALEVRRDAAELLRELETLRRQLREESRPQE